MLKPGATCGNGLLSETGAESCEAMEDGVMEARLLCEEEAEAGVETETPSRFQAMHTGKLMFVGFSSRA